MGVIISLFLALSHSLAQNRFILEGALEIHNGGQNARFGSALAPVPDLNGDGFNDLVVGAPLEDDHKGAVYIFFSQQNRILRKYKQVIFMIFYFSWIFMGSFLGRQKSKCTGSGGL